MCDRKKAKVLFCRVGRLALPLFQYFPPVSKQKSDGIDLTTVRDWLTQSVDRVRNHHSKATNESISFEVISSKY